MARTRQLYSFLAHWSRIDALKRIFTAKIISGYGAFVAEHPEVPWRSMRGMRNRIAHGYFEINLCVVWDTVQECLPELIEQLRLLRRSTI
ncbi:DUF86 domain-containing protein [Haematospirillum jordaniae]|uniref:HepT-like ribonuclease domain-containing protein n=1 Tax=Haematospirillum jordaniae TaxID=1549855 RepID=UPI0014332A90|nr:HepT-like ribonuclease domain-containing protein [Haematospirillum jordaniae]NKD86668.1 DUF86 domain-containing protein [Haematospirillum jordaniae]